MKKEIIYGAMALAVLGSGSLASCGDGDDDKVKKEDIIKNPSNNTKPDPSKPDPNKGEGNGGGTESDPEKDNPTYEYDESEIDLEKTPLKKIYNKNEHPYFHLACGISLDELRKEPTSSLVPQNFDEVTAGNEMKCASCIKWGTQSTWNFSNVDAFITEANKRGISVFGHTLAWHSQQPVEWLTSIVSKGTDEQKKEALTDWFEEWIDNMMKTCAGRVKAWDLVNEAISGADLDGDGKYDLQDWEKTAGNNYNIEGNNFFFQHYLGSEDYVPIVEKIARDKFEEYGGNADELLLFINDYNLESDWDDNKKLKSLIQWIQIWEEKGAKIDGIGSQMHISYYENEGTLESKKKHITKSFELMAATGKLVKISELDMGYVDIKGKPITGRLTDEQAAKQGELYEYIIKEYFRIVPKNQQYGITQWAITDAPDTPHMWRRAEPLGIWTTDYERKEAYYGFASGLYNK